MKLLSPRLVCTAFVVAAMLSLVACKDSSEASPGEPAQGEKTAAPGSPAAGGADWRRA